MGLDVNLYAEANPTPEQLSAAEAFFVTRTDIADTDERNPHALIAKDEIWYDHPRVAVNTLTRYYGPSYERGDWPAIYGAIRVLQAAFPGAKVFYGSDSSDDGIECTDEYLAEIWEHFLGPHGDDYRDQVRRARRRTQEDK